MNAPRVKVDWHRIRDDLHRRIAQPRTSFADDADRAAVIVAERTARLARAPTPRERRATGHFLVFACGDARFGLPLMALREVVRIGPIAPVPGAGAAVHGIMGWRGEFLTVFDALRVLGASSTGDVPPAYAAIFRGAAPFIAFAFDRPGGIARFDMSVLSSPSTWQSRDPDLFRGATADGVAIFDAVRLGARLRDHLRAA